MGDITTTCDWTAPGHGFDHGSLEEARLCGAAQDELHLWGIPDDEVFDALGGADWKEVHLQMLEQWAKANRYLQRGLVQ